MKIATYSQLPKGGAKISTQAIIDRLKKDHQVKNYHPRQHQQLPLHNFRLSKDLNSLVAQRSQAKKLARQIDRVGFGVCLVTHDTHFQAPWVLRYLQTPTIFLCQEPTRAFFEQFLAINSSWPLQNRLYESVIRAFKKKIEIKNAQSANHVIANSAFGAESILRAYAVPATPVHLE